MKNHFYMAYSGNKRTEVEEIFNFLNFNNITTIIEPFCGSCAMSFYIWLKYPNLKFILNDNDKFLKLMFETIIDDDKLNKFEELYKNKMQYIGKSKEKYKEVINNDDLIGWFIKYKIYTLRPGMFPSRDLDSILKNNSIINLKKYPIFNFFRNANIEFKNLDWLEIYEKYKNNDDCLILLDPPYISTTNSFYADPKLNIYEYVSNNDIKKEKAKIYFILENIWIIKLLFKNYEQQTYNKKYTGINKKIVDHIIISNEINNI